MKHFPTIIILDTTESPSACRPSSLCKLAVALDSIVYKAEVAESADAGSYHLSFELKSTRSVNERDLTHIILLAHGGDHGWMDAFLSWKTTCFPRADVTTVWYSGEPAGPIDAISSLSLIHI